jgi:hypothetical protein
MVGVLDANFCVNLHRPVPYARLGDAADKETATSLTD